RAGVNLRSGPYDFFLADAAGPLGGTIRSCSSAWRDASAAATGSPRLAWTAARVSYWAASRWWPNGKPGSSASNRSSSATAAGRQPRERGARARQVRLSLSRPVVGHEEVGEGTPAQRQLGALRRRALIACQRLVQRDRVAEMRLGLARVAEPLQQQRVLVVDA